MISTELYSFDVFDTLITRPFARPKDMFRVVATKVLGKTASSDNLNAFAAARVKAESFARKLKGERDDITLEEIYNEFEKLGPFRLYSSLAMEAEVLIEVESVVAIRSGVEAVQQLCTAGHRVIFVSDMYLPTHIISKMLRNAGLNVPDSSIYVSGQIGLSKHTGRIFDYISNIEKVNPSKCFHTGDNWKPDVLRPRQRGWQATLFTESALSRFENPKMRKSYWLSTRAGGVSRAARLRRVSGNHAESFLATNIIGPFLTSFVSNVLTDARRQGIDTLYFVSRDGQIFLKIAKTLQQAGLSPELECRYLYGSRQAWFLPSVTEAIPDQLKWAFAKGVSSSPRDILRRLEIDPSEVTNTLNKLGLCDHALDRMQSDKRIGYFIEQLLSPRVCDLIIDRAQQRRKMLIKYLGEQGVLDKNRHYALVDIGWSLQSQYAFRRSLIAEGQTADVHGYYLGVAKNHVPIEQVGKACSFVGFKGNDVPFCVEADWFFRLSTILLIEHLFTLCDHPSLAHYASSKTGIVPVFKSDHRDIKLISFTNSLHNELLAYTVFAWERFGEELVSSDFIEWSMENVRRFSCEPLANEVYPVAWLPTNRELTHEIKHTSKLATPLTTKNILGMVTHDLFPSRESYFSPNYAWNAGAAAISPAHIRGAYHILSSLSRKLVKLRATCRS